jgi:predicted kinase
MRNIVIVRGPQGSGKSGFVRRIGLEGHHLSFDKVREVVSGDTVSANGDMTIPQQHNQLVRALTFESLKRRMEDGETIAMEATFPANRDVMDVVDVARRHRYRILVVDFYGVPVERALAANAARPERVRVPEFAVRRSYEQASTQTLSTDLEVVRVESMDDLSVPIERTMAFLTRNTELHDASHYARIVHVGDLQGTIDPILDPASPLAGGLRDDTLYILCGDLFDRGVQNAAVAEWYLRDFAGRGNTVTIGGNHEDHVEIQSLGMPAVSREWRDHTWPQLQAAGFGEEHMARIAAELVPFHAYRWHGTEVLVTHGGLSRWPTHPHLIPESILRRGNGHYGQGIDRMWVDAERDTGRVQIHGHRNARQLPVLAAEEGCALSFNLEGQVEFGGNMRFAVLDAQGWHTREIRSKEFRTMVQARMIDRAAGRRGHGDEAPLTPWAERGEVELRPLSDETLGKFRDHSMIGETVSTSKPSVSSWNFTKSAFFTQNWDAYTSVARGLFVDNVDNTVVSRGAPKFYNTGERPETTVEAILAAGHGRADAYLKENGFFATVGYSERLGELIVTSKSRIEGTFPDMANAMIDARLGVAGRERMLRFCRDQKACFMFEVVDMVGDPHIIKEPEDKLVLLACIRRDEVFEQVPYETLQRIGAWIGCDVKENLYPNITNPRALEAIIRRAEKDAGWRRGEPAEGLVIEFADGFMVKVKAVYYAAWKKARGAVERLAMSRRKDAPFDRSRLADVPLIQEFLDWAETLPTEALGLHIIELRDAWEGAEDARLTREQVEALGSRPAPRTKDMSGYVKALEAMAANVAAGRAKPESVRRMIEAAQTDDDKRTAFEASDAGRTLTTFALENV